MIEAFVTETGEKSAAYRLLAYAVRRLYDIPCPEVAKDEHGKPFFPSRPNIFFSLSHTRAHVMVCLSDAVCGCDVETVRSLRPSVVNYVCSPEELADFSFFELWTLKESYLKLHGSLPHPFWRSRFYRSGAEIGTPSASFRAAVYDMGTAVCALCTPLAPPAGITRVPFDFLK